MPNAAFTSSGFHFFRAWVANPLRVASAVPSGRRLSAIITQEISAATGSVVELGPGTGVFTTALLERGVLEGNIVLIESGNEFIGHLRAMFPAALILEIDASQLGATSIFHDSKAGAVISGLPFLSMSSRKAITILVGVFRKLRQDGALYLFTYGYFCPVPRKFLDRLGLKATRIGGTLANFPPAVVYRIKRRSPPPLGPHLKLSAGT